MSETINLVVNFVSDRPNGVSSEIDTSVTQTGSLIIKTGDLLLFSFLAILLLILFILMVSLIKKGAISFSTNKVTDSKVMKNNGLCLTKNNVLVSIFTMFFAVLIVGGIFALSQAFAGSALTPDTNKITATVSDDGTILLFVIYM